LHEQYLFVPQDREGARREHSLYVAELQSVSVLQYGQRFRSEHLKECISRLSVQMVTILMETGQISLEVRYVDGTKIESVANKYTFVWKKTEEKNRAKPEKKIQSIHPQMEEGIARDTVRSEEPGTCQADAESLRRRPDALNSVNRERSREENRRLGEPEKHQAGLKEYERKPDMPGSRNSYSGTDKDATFMRMKEDAMNSGQTKPGYNVQTATENQYMTNFGLYPSPGDTATLASFLNLHKARSGSLPRALRADAGYGSEENYEMLETHALEAFVKYGYFHKEQRQAFRNNPFLQENHYYNEKEDYFVCPMCRHMQSAVRTESKSSNGHRSAIRLYQAVNCKGCPLRSGCHKAEGAGGIRVNLRLREYKRKAGERRCSAEGLRHRSRRLIEPEAVFGQIKYNRQYKRFRHKGPDKVNMDFGIPIMAFHLQKLHNRTVRQPIKSKTRSTSAQDLLPCVIFVFLKRNRPARQPFETRIAA
jgi:hypothetical protein